jgi:hypothetical protein
LLDTSFGLCSRSWQYERDGDALAVRARKSPLSSLKTENSPKPILKLQPIDLCGN